MCKNKFGDYEMIEYRELMILFRSIRVGTFLFEKLFYFRFCVKYLISIILVSFYNKFMREIGIIDVKSLGDLEDKVERSGVVSFFKFSICN